MIHVAYCTSNIYSKFAATSMLSLFENVSTPPPPSVIVHILHDNTLTPENRNKFNLIAEHYNQQVKFYNVEIICADRISKIKKLFSDLENSIYNIATFYRLFCADVLNFEIEKIIYLDSDTVVNLDIKKLWQFELNDKIVAV